MHTYLVGGAVRDKLLNLSVKDKDWLVVGATLEQMQNLGYQQVGRDFPVFLHPKTHEEYALARTERKKGSGYTGFICHFSPDVTLEEDLCRRDLTINAIAMDSDGTLYDPYLGQQDLNARILRHVSPAFVEDPLRVLRVARFAARFSHLGFTIADETLDLMQDIVTSGELAHLTAERVWQEWQKSLSYDNPEVFIQVLYDCGALEVILPELNALFSVPEKLNWHPEGNAGAHTLLVIKQACRLTSNPIIRFAAQLHDLGKALTDKESWPSHHQHEHLGLNAIKNLSSRLKIPNEYKELAILACRYHMTIHRAEELKNKTFVKLFDELDLWRKPERLEPVLQCCIADAKGSLGSEKRNYPQADIVREKFALAQRVNVKDVVADGFKGSEIRDELHLRRIQALSKK